MTASGVGAALVRGVLLYGLLWTIALHYVILHDDRVLLDHDADAENTSAAVVGECPAAEHHQRGDDEVVLPTEEELRRWWVETIQVETKTDVETDADVGLLGEDDVVLLAELKESRARYLEREREIAAEEAALEELRGRKRTIEETIDEYEQRRDVDVDDDVERWFAEEAVPALAAVLADDFDPDETEGATDLLERAAEEIDRLAETPSALQGANLRGLLESIGATFRDENDDENDDEDKNEKEVENECPRQTAVVLTSDTDFDVVEVDDEESDDDDEDEEDDDDDDERWATVDRLKAVGARVEDALLWRTDQYVVDDGRGGDSPLTEDGTHRVQKLVDAAVSDYFEFAEDVRQRKRRLEEDHERFAAELERARSEKSGDCVDDLAEVRSVVEAVWEEEHRSVHMSRRRGTDDDRYATVNPRRVVDTPLFHLGIKAIDRLVEVISGHNDLVDSFIDSFTTTSSGDDDDESAARETTVGDVVRDRLLRLLDREIPVPEPWRARLRRSGLLKAEVADLLSETMHHLTDVDRFVETGEIAYERVRTIVDDLFGHADS